MFRLEFSVLKLVVPFMVILSCSGDGSDTKDQPEKVYINEIYASEGDDWIELYNDGASSKDIGGFSIYDDATNKYMIPSGTTIVSKGFLVLYCDGTGTGLNTSFKLSSAGETISLEDASGKLVDRVVFPMLEDGQVYARFPDGSDNLGLSGLSAKGAPNGEVQGAVIRNVNHYPLVPGTGDKVRVEAEVASNSGISSVQLFYRMNGGNYTSLAMTGNLGIFSAEIPPLNATGSVEYYISVKNSTGLTTLHPFDAPADNHWYLLNTDPLPLLKINEFMASNASCCPDTGGGTNEFDDWVEIYNAGSTPVNIGGMYLSDDLNDPFKSRIPDTDAVATTIPPGGFLLVWADEDQVQGPLHVNFKLAADGEDIGIFYLDGRTIDSYTYPAQQVDMSSGLSSDGGVVWKIFADPTPGLSNE